MNLPKQENARLGSKGKSLELAHLIREKIRSGEIPPGKKFDTIPKIAADYQVAVATMSKIFAMLEDEGLIERINGVGVYVKQKAKYRFALVFDSAAEQGVFSHKPIFMQHFTTRCRAEGMEYTVFENIDNAETCQNLQKQLKQRAYDVILIASLYFAQHSRKYLQDIPILPIGLYPYKWLECSVSFQSSDAILRAGALLQARGCERVGLITRQEELNKWCWDEIVSDAAQYQLLCDRDPVTFRPELLKNAVLSPRGGYEKANELLNLNLDVEKLGIISTDEIFTHGILSAILQSRTLLWEKVLVVSHAISGSLLADFSIPVTTYGTDKEREVTRLFELVEQYFRSKVVPAGHHLLSYDWH